MLNTDEYAQLSKEQRAIYDAASPREAAAFAATWRNVSHVEVVTGPTITNTSMMRDIGRVGTFVAFALAVLLFLIDATSYESLFAWVAIALSATATFMFAWMLGAIETRLIAINETLKAQKEDLS
ncbi:MULTISPECIES: hypothetical protein [unclassified Brevundimonas]|uniref:hypothetical protein n=1 Tax=unclassified Brevundimonas TaxID=2622653 RepID=UPI0025BDA6EC|nr:MULTISPECIES: hypothetical protein [unclassified Brevundimonas]